jgi:hypothetical protein
MFIAYMIQANDYRLLRASGIIRRPPLQKKNKTKKNQQQKNKTNKQCTLHLFNDMLIDRHVI